MLDKSFIEEIRRPIEPKILDDSKGHQYSTAQLHNLPRPDEPKFPTIQLETLDSLVDYAQRHQTDLTQHKILCSHAQVQIFGPPAGENRSRDIVVTVLSGAQPYQFGQWQDLETFRVSLLTLFEESDDRVEVLKFISKLSDDFIKTSQDDGVTQTATVRQGLASFGEARVPSPVKLRPIRTFMEVQQPEEIGRAHV